MFIFIPELISPIFSYLLPFGDTTSTRGKSRSSIEAVNKALLKPDLYECMKVCKKWYSLLAPIYYQEVLLPIDCKPFFEFSQTTLLDGSSVGDHIKTLRFSPNTAERLDELQFYKMMLNLPHLRSIVLPFPIIDGYESYFETIPENYLKHIEEISLTMVYKRSFTYDYGNLVRPHFVANCRFADKITRLSLLSVDGLIEFTHDGKCYDLLSVLPNFKCLTHLSVANVGFNEATETVHLASILNACKGLVSLEFFSNFPWCLTENQSFIFTNLTSLKLDVISMTEDNLNFMMQYIPNLNKFMMCFSYVSFPSLLLTLDQDKVVKFGRYLQKIPSLDIRGINCNQDQAMEDLPLKTQMMWIFLQALSSENTICNLRVHTQLIEESREHFVLAKRNNIIGLDAHWLLDIPDPDEIDGLTFGSVVLVNTHMPTFHFIPQSIAYLKAMNLLELLERQQQTHPCSVLLKSRKQLLEFSSKYQPLHQVTNEHSSRLWSQSKRGPGSISYGHIRNIQLTSELLQALGQQYPKIEKLVLEKCTIEKEDRANNHFSIDLSYFDSIHQLVVDFDAILPIKKLKRPLYIQFTKETSSSYYHFKQKGSCILLHPLGESCIPTAQKRCYVFQIKYSKLGRFTFRRHGIESESQVLSTKQ